MKTFTITLNENQLEALNYILHRAHHIPLSNSTKPDVILPLSRELVEIVNSAEKNKENEIMEFSEVAEDMHAGAMGLEDLEWSGCRIVK